MNPFQVLFVNFRCFDFDPLRNIVGMELLDAFSGGFELAFEHFDPEAIFARSAAFALPFVNGVDGSVDLHAGGDSFVHQSIGDCSGIAFGFDGRPANIQVCGWARRAAVLLRSRNKDNNRLTRNRFKVKGRIPFTKRRYPL